jgi:hypothetical protein
MMTDDGVRQKLVPQTFAIHLKSFYAELFSSQATIQAKILTEILPRLDEIKCIENAADEREHTPHKTATTIN